MGSEMCIRDSLEGTQVRPETADELRNLARKVDDLRFAGGGMPS